MIDYTPEEIIKLHEAAESAERVRDVWESRVAELELQVSALSAALWFYADQSNWSHLQGDVSAAVKEHGYRAIMAIAECREALKAQKDSPAPTTPASGAEGRLSPQASPGVLRTPETPEPSARSQSVEQALRELLHFAEFVAFRDREADWGRVIARAKAALSDKLDEKIQVIEYWNKETGERSVSTAKAAEDNTQLMRILEDALIEDRAELLFRRFYGEPCIWLYSDRKDAWRDRARETLKGAAWKAKSISQGPDGGEKTRSEAAGGVSAHVTHRNEDQGSDLATPSSKARSEPQPADTSNCLGVGDGSGNLFVYGTYEAIKACQALVLRTQPAPQDTQLKRLSKDDPNYIDWMEAFDCDVEDALDQVSMDPKVRGQIRWMVMKQVSRYTEIEMELRAKLKALDVARQEGRKDG